MKTDKLSRPCGCPVHPLPLIWSLPGGPAAGSHDSGSTPQVPRSKHLGESPSPKTNGRWQVNTRVSLGVEHLYAMVHTISQKSPGRWGLRHSG